MAIKANRSLPYVTCSLAHFPFFCEHIRFHLLLLLPTCHSFCNAITFSHFVHLEQWPKHIILSCTVTSATTSSVLLPLAAVICPSSYLYNLRYSIRNSLHYLQQQLRVPSWFHDKKAISVFRTDGRSSQVMRPTQQQQQWTQTNSVKVSRRKRNYTVK